MDTQHFCLKWNNHQGNLLKVFDNLLSSETFVDVTLACNGSSIKAHKIVLSACSPFFEELFKNNPCKHPIVILKDLNFNDLKTIVQFMYKGEVNITQERLSLLLKTAENLQIRGLTELGGDNQVREKQDKPHNPSVPAKRRVQSENVKRTSVIHSDNDVVPSSRDSDCASPEIIEQIPPKQRKQVLSQPEPEFTSSDNLDYSSSFNNALANSNMMSQNNKSSIDNTSKPSTSEFCENFEGSNEEMFNLTYDQYQNDSMKIQTEDAAANIKPGSPQILPIQLDHEISRVKSQNDDFDSYDPGNSMDSFNDPSFQDPTYNSPASNIMNSPREIQSQNSSHEMLGESSKSQSTASGVPQGRVLRNGKHECPVCHRLFYDKSNMTTHYKSKHGAGNCRKHQCHICHKTYKWLSQLSNHLDFVHHIRKEFECSVCGKFFHFRSKVTKHIASYHPGIEAPFKHHPEFRKY